MAHIHSVYDTGEHFVIDPLTRAVTNADGKKIVLIQHDHNSERFTFEMPKTVEGHDVLSCNQVQVHYINTDGKQASADVYEVDDIQVSPADDNVAVFSWLVSGNATKYAGVLDFVVRFACVTADKVEYLWQTARYSGIKVDGGICNSDAIAEEYSDILAQWYARLFLDDSSLLITPEMFGAIGDGVTDDSAAINAMFATITNTNSNATVKFSKKTYALQNGIRFYPACNVDFNSAKLLAVSDMDAVITVLDNRDYYVYSFANLYIDCNDKADYGVYIDYTRGNEFNYIRIENFNVCGFYLKKGNLNGHLIRTANLNAVKGVGVQLDGTDCNIDTIITQSCLTGVVCNGGPNSIGKIHAWTAAPTFSIDNTVAFEQNSLTMVGTLYADTVALGVKSSITSGCIDVFRIFDSRETNLKTVVQAIQFSSETNGNFKWRIGSFGYQNANVKFSNMTPLDMFICNPDFIGVFNMSVTDTITDAPILSRELTAEEVSKFVTPANDTITIVGAYADKNGNMSISATFNFASVRDYKTTLLNFLLGVLSPSNVVNGNGYNTETNLPISVIFGTNAVSVAGDNLKSGTVNISYSRGLLSYYRTQ